MRRFALIPAAGTGTRLGADAPKQYLPVAGVPMIARTVAAFLHAPRIDSVTVAVAPDDARFAALGLADRRLATVACGGATRAATVRAALATLDAEPDDWVLVHDAARCGIDAATIEALIDALDDDPVGGLLALPVADTVKRALPAADSVGGARVDATVDRADLWVAQTPQMFRRRLLSDALDAAARAGHRVTDEASALELAGHRPRLVPGTARNFKVTTPDDLALMDALLRGPS